MAAVPEWKGARWIRLRQGPLGTVRAEPCGRDEAEWVSLGEHLLELDEVKRRAADEVQRAKAEASNRIQAVQAEAAKRVQELEAERERLKGALGRALRGRKAWKRRALGQTGEDEELIPLRLEQRSGVWWLVMESQVDAEGDAQTVEQALDVVHEAEEEARRYGGELRRARFDPRRGWVLEVWVPLESQESSPSKVVPMRRR